MLRSIFLLILASLPLSGGDYRRQDWPHWREWKCLDAREQSLISHARSIELSADGCRVVSGEWILAYSGELETRPRRIDVDHVIPLEWAHRHGADGWTLEKRRAFANDLLNLLPSAPRENRRKGSRGPLDWLPVVDRCRYRGLWLAVAGKYQLEIPLADLVALETGCL